MAFSRQQTLQPGLIDLRESLADLSYLFNRLVGETVSLNIDYGADLSGMMADKRKLEQVMMNLVVNARDATLGGGEVLIKTANRDILEPLEEEQFKVPPGAYVSVKVIDAGTGIATDHIGKFFEPFYSTKKQGGGAGLAFRQFMASSNNLAVIFSRGASPVTGQNSRFCSRLRPLKRALRRELLRRRPLAAERTGEGAVLLVEDEVPARAFASRALQMRGYDVLEADSGETALALLSDPDLHIDLFLSDVIMPGVDGPTWVKEALA